MLEITSETKKGLIIMHVRGELDLNTATDFKNSVNDKLSLKPSVLALGFSGVTFLDSSGVGALVKLNKTAHDNNIELVFYDLEEGILNMFRLSRLETIFTILTRKEFFEKYIAG